MKRLSKKLLAIFLAVVLSAFPSLAQATTISGAQDETLDDKIAILTSMLDDSAEIAQGWKQIGISANDVVDLARTGLRPDFKFRDTTAKQIQTGKSDVKNITSLSANSKIASSAAKGSIEPDPHIPQDSKEQDERIAYILRAGHRLYGNMEGTDAYSKNVMYLYLSYFTDNPAYSCSNPDFTSYLCDIISDEDKSAYDAYIKSGNAVNMGRAVTELTNMVCDKKEKLGDVKAVLEMNKIPLLNMLNLIYNTGKTFVEKGDDIKQGWEDLYEYSKTVFINVKAATKTATTEDELYRVANLVPRADSLKSLPLSYTENLVTGIIYTVVCGPSLGATVAFSTAMVESFSTYFEYAAFVALKTSFSSRYAKRVMISIGMG